MIEPKVLKCLFVAGFWSTKIYLPRVSALNNANVNFWFFIFQPFTQNSHNTKYQRTWSHPLHQNNNSQLAGYGVLYDVGGFDWKQNTTAETVNLITICSQNWEKCEEKASQRLLE